MRADERDDGTPPLSSLTPDELAQVFGVVRTQRLTLRRPVEGDVEAMFRIHGDPETYRFTPISPDPDRATSAETLGRWLQGWRENGYGYWAVLIAPDDAVVGFGGVRRFDWQGRDILNLYYRFTPSVWGRGYATETARAAVDLARRYLRRLPVVARIRPANVASARVAERAGLSLHLLQPDVDTDGHLIFSLGSNE